MVYNKRSTQWLSRVCFYIGVGALLTIVAIQWNSAAPEIDVLNSLETVNKIQLSLKSLFK